MVISFVFYREVGLLRSSMSMMLKEVVEEGEVELELMNPQKEEVGVVVVGVVKQAGMVVVEVVPKAGYT